MKSNVWKIVESKKKDAQILKRHYHIEFWNEVLKLIWLSTKIRLLIILTERFE